MPVNVFDLFTMLSLYTLTGWRLLTHLGLSLFVGETSEAKVILQWDRTEEQLHFQQVSEDERLADEMDYITSNFCTL